MNSKIVKLITDRVNLKWSKKYVVLSNGEI